MCHSRWNITEKLVELFRNSDTPPSVLISGSAAGYYGDLGEVVVTEEEPPHNEFTHKLCARWEQIACGAQSDKTRVWSAAHWRRPGSERRHSGQNGPSL
ncbi:Cell division inhibitor [Enterobacter cancerogenus]|uniref:Cell division inhibitor n=1 Tax=Enterobacter cancerogenus TaxID=69218 RepID=A0A484Z7V4_9ENTR|nr:Cell division inhibitor [Enterobacter cancerogenus]